MQCCLHLTGSCVNNNCCLRAGAHHAALAEACHAMLSLLQCMRCQAAEAACGLWSAQ